MGTGEDGYDIGGVDDSPILDTDSVEAFNYLASLPRLVEAAGSSRLGAWPRTQIAITAWTRAFVLGKDGVANRLIPILEKAHPAWTADLEAFGAANGEEKRFAGALLIARHGDFHTYLWSDFRPNRAFNELGPDWWCGEDLHEPPKTELPEAALPANDRAEAAVEIQRLHAAGNAQTFLAPIVMSWVEGTSRRTPRARIAVSSRACDALWLPRRERQREDIESGLRSSA